MSPHSLLVSAAALSASGARTIYLQFIEHLKTRVDGNRYYIMVDKDMDMPPISGVCYWLVDIGSKAKRLKFELWGMRRLLKKKAVKIDAVISLQNLGIRCLQHLPQIIYYHNSLPFFAYKWNPFKKTEAVMLLYKHLYPLLVKHSMGRDVEMVVQLPSIKRGVVQRYGMAEERVHVLFPDLEQVQKDDIVPYRYDKETINFIFPATNVPYKGHGFLTTVMKQVWARDKQTARCIRIHLTLNEEEGAALMKGTADKRQRENFVFHGIVPHEQLLSMYRSANGLLFPCTIETLGLPLIEAARMGTPIVACNLEYAHEVLRGYAGVTFVEARSAKDWAAALLTASREKKTYKCLQQPERSSWEEFFDIIDSMLHERR